MIKIKSRRWVISVLGNYNFGVAFDVRNQVCDIVINVRCVLCD